MAENKQPNVIPAMGSREYRDNWVEILAQARKKSGIAVSSDYDSVRKLSPLVGDYFIALTYELVMQIAKDYATFSSKRDPDNGFEGITIVIAEPGRSSPMIPIEMDPPQSSGYRRLLHPLFSPKEAERWRPYIKDVIAAVLNEKIEEGEIDFVKDVSGPVPAIFTMAFLGLPIEQWRELSETIHENAELHAASDLDKAEGIRRVGRWMNLFTVFAETVAQRRADPKEDFISDLIASNVFGEPLDDDAIVNISIFMLAAGTDTTSAAYAGSVHWLDQHPEQWQYLLDHPESLDRGIEELLRYLSPVHQFARTVTTETQLGEQKVCPFDRVIANWAAANHDPEMFENPDTVVLDRSPNKHIAFGFGNHRCLGLYIARVMLSELLKATLTRMPDFKIDQSRAERYKSIAVINGFNSLPATFTPGPRVPTDGVIDFAKLSHFQHGQE